MAVCQLDNDLWFPDPYTGEESGRVAVGGDLSVDRYIEWWTNVSTSMYVDENGRRTLVYLLSGSPLTGANSCGIVHEDGETESACLNFHSLWSPFIKVNRRYTQAKELYQAYTLEEVLDILHQEDDNCQTFEHSIDKVFMECEIKFLKQEIEKFQGDRDNWHRIYEDTLFRYNEDRIRQFYSDFLEMESQTNAEIDQTKQKIKELKADLRNKDVPISKACYFPTHTC